MTLKLIFCRLTMLLLHLVLCYIADMLFSLYDNSFGLRVLHTPPTHGC